MKKTCIQLLFTLLPAAIFSQSAVYIEFTGSGIVHRGILMTNAQGQGTFRVAYSMNGSFMVVEQSVQVMQGAPTYRSNTYNGWQQVQPQSVPQNPTVILACNNPIDVRTGQPANGYIPDNFILSNGQMVNKSGSLSCTVSYRGIQSQQEFEMLVQNLGLAAGAPVNSTNTPRNVPPPPPVASTPNSNGPGPKYPTGNGGGGLGFAFPRQ